MTNKEAIKILKNYHNGYFGYKIDDVHEAHNIAIKALEDIEERPQGDLISREELKKAIDDYAEKRQDTLLWQADVEEIIDNAPTVEAKTTYDVNSAYDRGFITAMKEYSKPQGEWNEILEPFGWDDILSARCSVCGESYPYPEETGFNDIVEMFKYCPNCGAKMEAGTRWKEEEDEE